MWSGGIKDEQLTASSWAYNYEDWATSNRSRGYHPSSARLFKSAGFGGWIIFKSEPG